MYGGDLVMTAISVPSHLNDSKETTFILTKVSIITVCHNSASTIEKTIQSVCAQTHPNIEYIIIDGGSHDGTQNIIKKYSNHISFWVSEPDKGISDAFNKGIQQATGNIIGILNADDWYTQDAVENAVRALLENPLAGFVFGDLYFVNNDEVALYKQTGDPGYQNRIRYEMPSIPHPTVFIRKEIYDKFGGFNTLYKTAMDYELLLRLTSNAIAGVYIPKIMAFMRLGGESDNNFVRGYNEVRMISIDYGYNEQIATIYFLYKCIKSYIRRKLQQLGFDSIIKLFRTYFNDRYKYN